MSVKKKIRMWENRRRLGFALAVIIAVSLLALGKGVTLRAQTVTLGNVVFTLENGYHMVETADQLLVLGQIETNDAGSKFRLVKDIEVPEVNKAAISTFAGEFDGQGYKITYNKIAIATTTAGNTPLSLDEGILFGTVTGKATNLFVEFGGVDYKFKDTYQPGASAEKGKKKVYFGLVGAVEKGGSITNLQVEGAALSAAIVEYTAVDLYAGAVAGRISNATISGIIQNVAVNGAYVRGGQNDGKESFLYMGGITGLMDTGAIVQDCHIAKQTTVGTAINNVLKSYAADITGTGNSEAKASCFIINNGTSGTVSGDGAVMTSSGYTTFGKPGTNIETIDLEKFAQLTDMENWKCFSKDVTGKTDVYTLNWLLKSSAHSCIVDKTTVNSIKMVIAADNNNEHLDGTMKYHYRPSINEGEKEVAIELKDTDNVSIQLGASAYLLIKHIYYTDGKYHYYKGSPDEEYIYPYMGEAIFRTGFEDKLLRDVDQDYIQVTGNMPQSGSNVVFYYVNKVNTDKFPVKENPKKNKEYIVAESVEGEAGNGTWNAYISFEGDNVQLNGFWTLDEKIYPIAISREYDESDLESLEAPEGFSISGYYRDNGAMLQLYAGLLDGQEKQAVHAGQKIKIDEYNEENVNRKIEYLCLFSTESSAPKKESAYREEGVTYTYDFTTGIPNLSIPDGYGVGDEFYLHIMKYKKGLNSGYATLGFQMTSAREVKPSKPSNSVVTDGSSILLDVGELDGADGIKGIRYLLSSQKLEGIKTLSDVNGVKVSEYKKGEAIEIMLNREEDEMRKYLYVQYYGTYDKEAICGQLQVMEYAFADKTGSPSITPDTIMYTSDAGVLGALTCDTYTKAKLTGAEKSTIIYCLGESEATELFYSKVIDDGILMQLVEKAQNDQKTCILMDRLYVQSNGFWYLMSEGAKLYKADEGILLNNSSLKVKYIHILAVAFEENKEQSDLVHYVYEVEPQEETAAPTAVLNTSAGEPTSVPLHSALFFQSTTPDAEIYYTLDGTVPGIVEGGSTKKYDVQKGILVKGAYSGLFRVNLVAVKNDGSREIVYKPSKSISFVYRIADQDTVSSPTSIPATTGEDPTVLSPGKKILLSTDTKGAVIYYTVDGTEPKVNGDGSVKKGSLYDATTGILMPEEGADFFTIKAIAVKGGMKNSAVTQATFCYPNKVQAPYASPASGVVDSGTSIMLTNATEGATIYYEIAYGNSKPKTPTDASAVFDSGQPFVITKKTTIKAIAVKDGVKSKAETFTYDTSELSNAPTASIASGSVVSRSTMLTITSGSGSAIYYTTNGSDPTETSNMNVVAGQTLLLDGEFGSVITVKAVAKAADKAFSEVSSFTYQISSYQGGVTSSMESGAEVSRGATVNLMSDISNARIYYTIDGTSPSAGSALGTAVTLYGEPGTIVTVKAMAIPDGVTLDVSGSSMAIFNYKIKETITAPEASPGGGTLTAQISVTLTAAKGDVYYTTDGSTPSINSTRYKDPITVSKSMVIKAIAATGEGEVSGVSSFTYSTAMRAAKPVSSVAAEVLEPGTVVRLSSQTVGAVIYYSTDGTTPSMDNLESLLVHDREGITVNRTVSIQAAAYKDGYLLSNTTTFQYVVTTVPAEVERKKREAKEAAMGLQETDATGLKVNGDSSISDPAFAGTILKEDDFDTMVSAKVGIIPENTHLVTREENCKDSVLDNLRALLGKQYEMLCMYDINLYEESKSIQPGGEMEIGLPIPEGYENAAVQIVYVDQDGNIKIHETRRSNGRAYAITDHFSLYGLAGVKEEEKRGFSVDVVYLVVGVALAIAVVGAVFFCVQFSRKRQVDK